MSTFVPGLYLKSSRKRPEARWKVVRGLFATFPLLWSWVLSFENDKHPRPDRRDEIAVWERLSERSIPLSSGLEDRSRQIAQQGLAALDAAHLAAAEAGGADIMLTCDDVMIKRAPRLGLALRVLNPMAYLSEVTAHG
jgi:hypothetical protein